METFEFLKSSIMQLSDVDVSTFTTDTELSAVGLDSLDYVSVQLEVNKKYGVKMDFDDFSSGKITTLGDFAKYIDSRVPA